MQRRFAFWTAGSLLAATFLTSLHAGPDAEPVQDGKPLSKWVQQLKSPNKEERQRAAETLGKLASKARSAAPALLAAVQEKEGGEVNEAAANALIQMGPAVVPLLIQAMWGEDHKTRKVAIFLLGKMDGNARPAIASLLEVLKDDDLLIRLFAVRALGDLRARSAIPALLSLLEKNDPRFRRHILAALMQINVEAETIVPILSTWLQAQDEDQRLDAANALAELGGEAAPAIGALIDTLGDEKHAVGVAAARALGRIGPLAKDAVPVLTAALKEKKWADARVDVAEALWRIARHADVAAALKAELKEADPSRLQRVRMAALLWRIDKAPEAIAALSEVLREGTAEERGAAIAALTRIGPEAKAALPAAVALLKEKDFRLRFAVLMFLSRLGEHAKPARRPLTKALEDEKAEVRLAAALALWRIDKDQKRISPLVRALEEPDVEVRRAAAEWLGEIGPEAREAVPSLTKLLKDRDVRVRLRSAAALWNIDRGGDLLAVMRAGLQDDNPAIRAEAATGLGFVFRSEGRPAVTALMKHLWDDDSLVRSAAAESLGRIGPPTEKAVPALIALLRGEEEDHVHSAAAEALGRFGPAAKEAMPVLIERLKHPDRYVRVCAALALWHIDRNRAGLPAAAAALHDHNPRVRVIAAEMLGHTKQYQLAIATLLEVLREASVGDQPTGGNIRFMAARSLGRLGPPAKSAVPDLLELLHDEEEPVRATAAEALKRIDPQAAKAKLP
jgi:HEAT repeat protein